MKNAVIIIGVLIAAFAGYKLFGSPKSAEGPAQGGSMAAAAPGAPAAAPAAVALPVLPSTVIRRDVRQVLDVTGSLRTDDDVQVGSRIEGRAVAVLAKEGDRVRQGQVLVKLDDREIKADIASAQGILQSAQAKLSLARNTATWKDTQSLTDLEDAKANVEAAKARVTQAETAEKLADVDTRAAVRNAEGNVQVAKERLAIAKESTRKQELRQAQLAVDQATATLEQSRVDVDNQKQVLTRRQQLYKQDAIAKEEVDEADRRHKAMIAAQRVAEAGVSVAQQKLDLAKEGSRPEEVRVAEEQLRTAQQDLDRAKSDERKRDVARDQVLTAKAAQKQAEAAARAAQAGLVQSKMSQDDIAAARAAIAQARADIAVYRTQLEDLTIYAPVNGVVSWRQVNVGEMVTKTTPVMNLVALDSVFFEAQVPELEVSLVKPGTAASVTVDAIPGKTFAGTVREVIPVADRTSRAFRVRIGVPGGRGSLPANGYARAQVHVGTHGNVLVVRKSALQTEAGDTFVWLIKPEGGKFIAAKQKVQPGLVDGDWAEIRAGLTEGERVITAGSPAIIEGTLIDPNGAEGSTAPVGHNK